MRPFFSYYGAKYRAADRYPRPRYPVVIEPFAGSAGYSTRHRAETAVLYDTSPHVGELWQYLVSATEAAILSLPDLEPGQSVDEVDVPDGARSLIGFWINKGAAAPRKRASAWMRSGIRPNSFWGPAIRQRIASQLNGIRAWRPRTASYLESPDVEATWFIDPPYQGAAGRHYPHSDIDYGELARWTLSRRGQVIVCEAEHATWLPFKFLADVKANAGRGRSRVSREMVFLHG